jgi:hypothetical protein
MAVCTLDSKASVFNLDILAITHGCCERFVAWLALKHTLVYLYTGLYRKTFCH